MNNTLFRKESIDRISSPEQLDAYIKVSNPGVWIMLAALCAILAAALVWGVTGSLPTKISVPGVMRGGQAVCYLSIEDAAKVKAGQAVTVKAAGRSGTFDGKVSEVAPIPLSSSEVAAELNSDYLFNTLTTEEYSVRAVISVSQIGDADTQNGNAVPRDGIAEGTVLDLKIIVEEKKPFYFLGD